MRRLVALGVVVLAVTAPLANAGGPSAADLESELVCPTCQTTLDMSSSEVATRMKAYIRQRLAAGATAEQIKSELVDQFGRGVLAEPPRRGFDLLAWALPLGIGILGLVVVGGLAWAWRRAARSDPEAPLDPELERRVDEELARFEG